MYKTVFDGKTFDVEKFVKFPKCTNEWGSTDAGVGCLLTALAYGFGIRTKKGIIPVIEGNLEPSHYLVDNVDHLAINLGVVKGGSSISDDIVKYYDNGEGSKALDITWEIIKALPNKVGMYNKEDTIMPCMIKPVTTKEEVPVS